MKVQVLGTGCTRCKKLIENAEKAIQEFDEEITLEKIEDLTEITRMGVMTTPGFAINDKIMATGKVLSKD